MLTVAQKTLALRDAKASDVDELYTMIKFFSDRGMVLSKTMGELRTRIRNFIVCEEDDKVIGCATLHSYSIDLAEIRTLVVRRDKMGQGIGKMLVGELLSRAAQMYTKKIFVLTYQAAFFSKMGFNKVDKSILPQKIWDDCVSCSRFFCCDETAMIYQAGA